MKGPKRPPRAKHRFEYTEERLEELFKSPSFRILQTVCGSISLLDFRIHQNDFTDSRVSIHDEVIAHPTESRPVSSVMIRSCRVPDVILWQRIVSS